MKSTNYVKLTIRGVRRYADGDAVPHDYTVSPSGDDRLYVTTWIFPFVDELAGDAHRALASAEAKCEEVAVEHNLQLSRFRLTTYLASHLGLESVFGNDESEAA
jgi:hypothetical protein